MAKGQSNSGKQDSSDPKPGGPCCNCGTKTPLQSGVQLIENHVSTARRKDISQNSAAPELTLNLHSTSRGKT